MRMAALVLIVSVIWTTLAQAQEPGTTLTYVFTEPAFGLDSLATVDKLMKKGTLAEPGKQLLSEGKTTKFKVNEVVVLVRRDADRHVNLVKRPTDTQEWWVPTQVLKLEPSAHELTEKNAPPTQAAYTVIKGPAPAVDSIDTAKQLWRSYRRGKKRLVQDSARMLDKGKMSWLEVGETVYLLRWDKSGETALVKRPQSMEQWWLHKDFIQASSVDQRASRDTSKSNTGTTSAQNSRCPKRFVGTITTRSGTIVCGDLTQRYADDDTVGCTMENDAEVLFNIIKMVSLRLGSQGDIKRFVRQGIDKGVIFNIPLDTKVKVTQDKGGIFKGRIKGTDKELWFLDAHFQYGPPEDSPEGK